MKLVKSAHRRDKTVQICSSRESMENKPNRNGKDLTSACTHSYTSIPKMHLNVLLPNQPRIQNVDSMERSLFRVPSISAL
jgi:hypothetical protein